MSSRRCCSRWHGEQAVAGAKANAARLESTRASGVANRQAQIDVATFIAWVDAYARGESRLERLADGFATDARTDIQRADDYVLAVVLFATSLFFAGIGTRLPQLGAQVAVVGLGCAIFLGTVTWLATFPVSLSV